eukprot:157978-Chlamydomonas_euryale.AAC.1
MEGPWGVCTPGLRVWLGVHAGVYDARVHMVWASGRWGLSVGLGSIGGWWCGVRCGVRCGEQDARWRGVMACGVGWWWEWTGALQWGACGVASKVHTSWGRGEGVMLRESMVRRA